MEAKKYERLMNDIHDTVTDDAPEIVILDLRGRLQGIRECVLMDDSVDLAERGALLDWAGAIDGHITSIVRRRNIAVAI